MDNFFQITESKTAIDIRSTNAFNSSESSEIESSEKSISSDSDSEENSEFEWSIFESKIQNKIPNFNYDNTGLSKSILESFSCLSPSIDFFKLYIDDNLIENLCNFTNSYYELKAKRRKLIRKDLIIENGLM